MHFWTIYKRRIDKKYRVIYKRGPSTVALMFAGMAVAAWFIFASLSSYPVFAYLYYVVKPATSGLISKALQETSVRSKPTKVETNIPSNEVAVKDVSLPEGHYLSIPKIGVDTILWEASGEEYEKALKKGVWRVGDFAEPGQSGKPVILAAHRFGYLEWTQEYRLKNSFYNLPKLKVGETIEVIWDQRRYTYQVERVTEGTEIDDYSGDLILYTCKFLVSPLRYFVYAKLIS
jgi:LPXTG-site transpeptidase (sortase) family protein